MESKTSASEMLNMFLNANDIDIGWYNQQLAAEIPRYARIVDMMVEEENNKNNEKNESNDIATDVAANSENNTSSIPVGSNGDETALTVEKIRQQFPLVKWLKRSEFIILPAEFELLKATQSIKDKNRSLYGMDAASGFACEFLDPQPGDKILDIACAPGGKLMLISELMKKEGMLIGVDVSLERLYTCRSLLRKYKTGLPKKMDNDESPSSWYLGVFHYDGTTFDVSAMKSIEKSLMNDIIFDSVEEIEILKKNHYGKRLSKKQKAEVVGRREIVYSKAFPKENEAYFDKVLVDAECTHDGSIKHVTKSFPITTTTNGSEENTEASTSTGMSNLSFVTRDMTALVDLQLNLLVNGFKNLKPNGVLVYSTCSFCKCQNEGVISKFLSMEPTARMIPVDHDQAGGDSNSKQGDDKLTQKQIPAIKSTAIPGCYLFSPEPSKTSGLFVSRMTKILPASD